MVLDPVGEGDHGLGFYIILWILKRKEWDRKGEKVIGQRDGE